MNPPGVEKILTHFMPPPIIAGSLAMVCYAATFIAVRDFAGVIPPAAITFLRCTIALLILYPICLQKPSHPMAVNAKTLEIFSSSGFPHYCLRQWPDVCGTSIYNRNQWSTDQFCGTGNYCVICLVDVSRPAFRRAMGRVYSYRLQA